MARPRSASKAAPEHRGDTSTVVAKGDELIAADVVAEPAKPQRIRLLERSFINNQLLEKGAVINYDGPLEKHMELV